jgi:hypothetical protein
MKAFMAGGSKSGLPSYISKMDCSHWELLEVSERMWFVNFDASISGECQT